MFNEACCGQPLPPSASAPIMTRCSYFIAGARICEFSIWRNSNPCPSRVAPTPFIERLIGTFRREYLDQTCFWNGGDATAS